MCSYVALIFLLSISKLRNGFEADLKRRYNGPEAELEKSLREDDGLVMICENLPLNMLLNRT